MMKSAIVLPLLAILVISSGCSTHPFGMSNGEWTALSTAQRKEHLQLADQEGRRKQIEGDQQRRDSAQVVNEVERRMPSAPDPR